MIATEGLVNEAFVAERCETRPFQQWREFVLAPGELAGSHGSRHRRAGRRGARRRAAVRHRRQRGHLLRLGVTEHSQGSTTVMGIANLAMATGNIGREGVGVQPAARPEQRAGLLRHGVFPARTAGLPPYSR